MNSPILAWLAEHYHWQLSLLTGAAIFALTFVLNQLLRLIPTFKAAHKLNHDTFRTKMQKPVYAANQKWNRKWAGLYLVVIFGLLIGGELYGLAGILLAIPMVVIVKEAVRFATDRLGLAQATAPGPKRPPPPVPTVPLEPTQSYPTREMAGASAPTGGHEPPREDR